MYPSLVPTLTRVHASSFSVRNFKIKNACLHFSCFCTHNNKHLHFNRMEFPSVGAHCDAPSCQSLDFLPYRCTFCQHTFCSPHRLPADHACTNWSMESHANSVQVCPLCEQLILTPKQHDSATIVTYSHIFHEKNAIASTSTTTFVLTAYPLVFSS